MYDPILNPHHPLRFCPRAEMYKQPDQGPLAPAIDLRYALMSGDFQVIIVSADTLLIAPSAYSDARAFKPHTLDEARALLSTIPPITEEDQSNE